jgi:site-specific recombinase
MASVTDTISGTPTTSEQITLQLAALRTVLDKLRAARPALWASSDVSVSFDYLSDTDIRGARAAAMALLRHIDFTGAFTGAGIPQGSSFAEESMRIVKARILPPLHTERDARYIIKQLFHDRRDHQIIKLVSALISERHRYYSVEEKKELLAVFYIQLFNAVKVLSYQIAALGIDEDIYRRAGKEDMLISPFMEQNRELNELLTNLENNNKEKIQEDFAQAKVMLRQCKDNIILLDKAAERTGASLRQTFLLRKLELLIVRLETLLSILVEEDTDLAFSALVSSLFDIVLLETNRRKLRYFLTNNINALAYRITENKRKTGEHYISSTAHEYWDLFTSACGGGFVIAFMVIIKMVLHHLGLPLLWEAIAYSLLYAGGFVLIHMLHFSVATKQPAMTAAYIAASLDTVKDDKTKYQHFGAMIAMVSRSQLASFAGNLFVVFPTALLLTFLFSFIIQHPIVDTQAAEHYLTDVHPGLSLSFWYAAIAGAFLFLSGLISGFGDNRAVVSQLAARIEGHPFFIRHIRDKDRLHRFALYIEQNAGPLMGNIAVGFMLGMSAFIGKITGLPFDIRHITFSTGNLALGFYGTHFAHTWLFVTNCILGVIIIGLFNFAVSFMLALQVAVRSRGLYLRDYGHLVASVWAYFKQHPLEFIIPPSAPKTAISQDTAAEQL